MRIEGLWGASPPTPVWPGSPQTALIFVGLPLLTALVLLATPLHDPGPPPPREEAAAPAAGVPAPEPRVAEEASGPAALPRTVAKRQRVADDGDVPAVIYETPRTRPRVRPPATGSAPAVTPVILARPAPAPEPTRLASAAASLEARTTSASVAPQSP